MTVKEPICGDGGQSRAQGVDCGRNEEVLVADMTNCWNQPQCTGH